ncbi:MAG: hypothetical protein M3O36_18075 [Myxococcota bacterium]|nr:hypothetical protein [Myxococcota bacterium]
MSSARQVYETTGAEDTPPAEGALGKRSGSGIVPRAIVEPDRLGYHLLRPRNAGPADMPLLGEAYRCWSPAWEEHLCEREGVTRVPSDDFTRQDEIGALFHEYECIGLTGYRWVDLSRKVHQDDSYFSVWPRDAIESVCADGSKVCIGNNLTVAAPWRNAVGCSVKELLLALAIERFLKSDADVLVGTMRNDRGMHSLGYRLGFRPVAQGLVFHGGPVDLVTFRRSAKRELLSPLTEAVIRNLGSSIL